MANISTTYLGLPLSSPVVASASPLSETVTNARQLAEAGAGAIVLHSLFEEEILASKQQTRPAAAAVLHDLQLTGPEGYMAYIRRLKDVVNVPIIGSLNGFTTNGWVAYAKMIEEAGADALELNMYYVSSDTGLTGEAVEASYLSLVTAVKAAVTIPVAVKIGPYFSAMSHMALQLQEAGADGLVLFNRFYQPDIDVEALNVISDLELSQSDELRLRLRWAGILQSYLTCDMAITGGVHTAEDVVKCMMVGAKVAMMTSALLENGLAYITAVNQAIDTLLTSLGYETLNDVRGLMTQKNVKDPAAFERANYMRVLKSY